MAKEKPGPGSSIRLLLSVFTALAFRLMLLVKLQISNFKFKFSSRLDDLKSEYRVDMMIVLESNYRVLCLCT